MYNKYTNKEKVIEALINFKKFIEPDWWTTDEEGNVIRNKNWDDKSYRASIKIFVPHEHEEYSQTTILTFIKESGQQYSNIDYNGTEYSGKRYLLYDILQKVLKTSLKNNFNIYQYLQEGSNFPTRCKELLESIESDLDNTILDFLSPTYLELINPPKMPQLSEKAVITATGKIKEKLPRKLKKALQNKSTHPNSIYGVNQIKKSKSKPVNHYQNVLDFIEKKKTFKLAPIHNNPNNIKHICLKHNDGNIIRLSRESANLLMTDNPGLYSYVPKHEWKIQSQAAKYAKESPKPNPSGKRQFSKAFKEVSKTELRPINGRPNSSIQIIPSVKPEIITTETTKKQKNGRIKVIKKVTSKYNTVDASITHFKPVFTKEQYMVDTSNPNYKKDPLTHPKRRLVQRERILVTHELITTNVTKPEVIKFKTIRHFDTSTGKKIRPRIKTYIKNTIVTPVTLKIAHDEKDKHYKDIKTNYDKIIKVDEITIYKVIRPNPINKNKSKKKWICPMNDPSNTWLKKQGKVNITSPLQKKDLKKGVY